MDTPKALLLSLGDKKFIGAVFDGNGKLLSADSVSTEEEARVAAIAKFQKAQAEWETVVQPMPDDPRLSIDPPMWDIYKLGPASYERYGRAEATVRHPFSDGSL